MFIQVIQGKVTDAEGLQAAMDRWGRDLQPGATGWLGTTGGITDDGTFVATVRFDSEEAARRNSERPEQGAWWAATEKCFDGPVTFFDCPQVDVWMNGGSDDAGFVQVVEGHTSDADRMREVMRRYADEMHAIRPRSSARPSRCTVTALSSKPYTSPPKRKPGNGKACRHRRTWLRPCRKNNS